MIDQNFTGITLSKEPYKEKDALVSIFTKELGLIRAFVQSSQKMTSKLNPHCEPLLLVRGRFIEKSRPRIVDAVTDHAFASLKRHSYYYSHTLELLRHVQEHSGELQQDERLWNVLFTFLHYLNDKPNERPEHSIGLFSKKINGALGY